MKRTIAALMMLMLVAMPFALNASAAAPAPSSPIAIPVTGTGPAGTFAGTFQLQKFVNDAGQVVATGLLTGTVTTAAGVVTSVVQTIALPVTVGPS